MRGVEVGDGKKWERDVGTVRHWREVEIVKPEQWIGKWRLETWRGVRRR